MTANLSSNSGHLESQGLLHTLKRFKDFSAAMLPVLRNIKAGQRQTLLRTLYKVAKQRFTMENDLQREKLLARTVRKRGIRFGQICASLKNALKFLEKAKDLCADGEYRLTWKIFVEDGIEDFIQLLRFEIKDTEGWHREMLAGEIHPYFRTRMEERTPVNMLHASFPGLGIARIDYWFIGELQLCLAEHGASLRPNDSNRIISQIFDAAFGERYDISRVKTARRRIAGRPIVLQ